MRQQLASIIQSSYNRDWGRARQGEAKKVPDGTLVTTNTLSNSPPFVWCRAEGRKYTYKLKHPLKQLRATDNDVLIL